MDTLRHPDSEVLIWFPYPYINLNESYFASRYFPQRSEKKIWARALVPDTPQNRNFAISMGKQATTTTRFIIDDTFTSFDIEIKIYRKNKLGIISYKEDLDSSLRTQRSTTAYRPFLRSCAKSPRNKHLLTKGLISPIQ